MATAIASSTEFGSQIHGELMYQDEECVVVDVDEDRQAPIHFKVVPKKTLPRMTHATEDDEKVIGHLLLVASNLAIQKGLHITGYHVMVDENHRTQRLNSLHVFGRALHHMLWPTGPGNRL